MNLYGSIIIPTWTNAYEFDYNGLEEICMIGQTIYVIKSFSYTQGVWFYSETNNNYYEPFLKNSSF